MCGIFLLGIALLSFGFDWTISEISAEITYLGFKNAEFPFFSYFHNGGSMVMQDPQGSLLSPITILIVIFGPLYGLRIAAFFWGFIGCYSFYRWLAPKVGFESSIIASCAWTLSLTIVWHLINGNDMFLWYLGLPLFLIYIEKLILKPTNKTFIYLGILTGIYILGPSFHALVFFIIPACILWFITLIATNFKKISKTKLALNILLIIGIALLIAIPKIYSWIVLDMDRTTVAEPVIFIKDALLALIDFRPSSMVKDFTTKTSYFYSFWEGNVALPPIATIFALLGLGIGWKEEKHRVLYIFAGTLLLSGIAFCTIGWIWESIRWIFNDGIRFSARYLALSGLGLAIYNGIGIKFILNKFKYKKVLTIILILPSFIFIGIWMQRASTYIISYANVEKQVVAEINYLWKSDRSWMKTPYYGYILDKQVIYEERELTGSGIQKLDPEKMQARMLEDGNKYLSPELIPNRFSMTNTSIQALKLQPHETVRIRLNPAPLGEIITTEPENSNVILAKGDNEIILTNNEDSIVNQVTITPQSPVPPALWFVSVITLLLTSGYLLFTIIPKIKNTETTK
ncbi:MAG: hypothetical protein Q8P90_00695 [bacterium]|nr:hypothetical protein [bacterium]